MNQNEILTKLSDFKGNLQYLFGKKIHRLLKFDSSSQNKNFDEDESASEDNYLDDLPLTMNRDPSPGVKYYTTENSEFARGAEKETPKGIDSFEKNLGLS